MLSPTRLGINTRCSVQLEESDAEHSCRVVTDLFIMNSFDFAPVTLQKCLRSAEQMLTIIAGGMDTMQLAPIGLSACSLLMCEVCMQLQRGRGWDH